MAVVNGDCRPQSRRSLGTISLAEVTTTAVVNYCASPPLQTRPIGDGVVTKDVDFLFSFQRGVRNLVCSLRIVKVLKIMKEKRIVAASDK